MNRQRWIIAVLLIAVVTAVVFLPSLRNGFTNFDDNEYVTENVLIREASLANIRKIFTSYSVGHYQPLTVLSYLVNYSLHQLEPFGYHLVNLILHLSNVLLVLWFLYMLTRSAPVAIIATLLFAVHPLRVESVAWVSERKDVLYAFFYLSSLISYLYYRRAGRSGLPYALSVFLFILALLSKAMAVTLPLILLLIDIYLRRRWERRIFLDKLPYLAASLACGIVAVTAAAVTRGAVPAPMGLWQKVAGSSFIVMFYLCKLILPVNLSSLYPDYLGNNPALYRYSFAGLLAAAGSLAVLCRRHARKALFAAGFFVITLFPVMHFVQRFTNAVGGAVADRHTYIASIGLFYALAEGFLYLYRQKLSSRAGRRMLTAGLIAVIVLLSMMTFRRCFVWKDSLSMWEDIQKEGTEAAFIHNSRGYAFYGQGDFQGALAEYGRALELDAGMVEAYSNRGILYYTHGMYEQALADYNTAIALNPQDGRVYINRGALYHRMGQPDAAVADYTRALEIDPGYTDGYNNRGMAYALKGDFDKAIADYSKALELDPANLDAYISRASAYYRSGDLAKAFADYDQVQKRDPRSAKPYLGRAMVLAGQGNLPQAIEEYSQAIEIDPGSAEAYVNRGNIYAAQGAVQKALADYDRAIELNPGHPDFYANRGIVYYGLGQLDKALADYNAALAIDPQNAHVYNNRAVAYLDKGDCLRSREDLQRAQSLGWQVHPGFLQDLDRSCAGTR